MLAKAQVAHFQREEDIAVYERALAWNPHVRLEQLERSMHGHAQGPCACEIVFILFIDSRRTIKCYTLLANLAVHAPAPCGREDNLHQGLLLNLPFWHDANRQEVRRPKMLQVVGGSHTIHDGNIKG